MVSVDNEHFEPKVETSLEKQPIAMVTMQDDALVTDSIVDEITGEYEISSIPKPVDLVSLSYVETPLMLMLIILLHS
ncbi:hypothetical protein CsSME_00006417 [Camellia sinensis var. sinensis]